MHGLPLGARVRNPRPVSSDLGHGVGLKKSTARAYAKRERRVSIGLEQVSRHLKDPLFQILSRTQSQIEMRGRGGVSFLCAVKRTNTHVEKRIRR